MRRVFTHLTQGWQRVPPSMTKSVFPKTRTFPLLSMATTNKTTKDPNHATKLVEADKHAKYDQLCQLLNPPLTCLPAVLTDFGGIGRELYSAIMNPAALPATLRGRGCGGQVGLGREEGEAALAPAH